MPDNRVPSNESYTPRSSEKSYQPAPKPATKPKPQVSYTPIRSGGSNPANNPTPPSDE